ncbi:MAG: GntR family transcriptional regulator [Rhodoferax sp.]|nr:GntR family transcriptional regulator [Rhodoferax sp.]
MQTSRDGGVEVRVVQGIKPVERAPGLVEQVYEALRAQLRGGELEVGQPLQELQLAERLGVSRTPVREAMARLASEGLLATERRSYTVPALTRRDIDDIYELRFLLEPAALRRIAPLTADRAARASIDAALADAASAHRDGDSAGFRDANVRYRAAWLALVPNPRLVRTIELYADHMQHIRALTLGDAGVRAIVLRGLQRITAALAAGDGDAAATALHAHLTEARRAFLQATGLDAEAAGEGASRTGAAPGAGVGADVRGCGGTAASADDTAAGAIPAGARAGPAVSVRKTAGATRPRAAAKAVRAAAAGVNRKRERTPR